jgi:hypothetical protein
MRESLEGGGEKGKESGISSDSFLFFLDKKHVWVETVASPRKSCDRTGLTVKVDKENS